MDSQCLIHNFSIQRRTGIDFNTSRGTLLQPPPRRDFLCNSQLCNPSKMDCIKCVEILTLKNWRKSAFSQPKCRLTKYKNYTAARRPIASVIVRPNYRHVLQISFQNMTEIKTCKLLYVIQLLLLF